MPEVLTIPQPDKGYGFRGEILMIVHRVPFPPDKGDKIRSYNQLKFLVERGWRVHLCALADDPSDLRHVEVLKKFCASVCVEPINPLLQKFRSLSGPLGNLPMSARYFYSARLQQRVNAILRYHAIDAVLCFCSPMAEYLRRAPQNPLLGVRDPRVSYVMDLVDVDSDKWAQYAEQQSGPMKWVYRMESQLLHRYERQIAEWFDSTVLVSDAEAEVFRRRTSLTEKIFGAANGVDIDYFHPPKEKPKENYKRISFCGVMGYRPNIDAVSWFAHEVFPRIRKQVEDVEFCIIGGGPGDEVRMLTKIPGVKVTGRVEDVRTYVWPSALSVAPIRIARGIQNKVLEAMSMGLPVLATPQAFEGLEAEPGRDLEVIDSDPEAFANSAISLLKDPVRRHVMGERARRLIKEKYCWESRLEFLEELLLKNRQQEIFDQAVA